MPLPGTNPQYPAEPLSNELQTTETRSRRSRMGFGGDTSRTAIPTSIACGGKKLHVTIVLVLHLLSHLLPKRKGAT